MDAKMINMSKVAICKGYHHTKILLVLITCIGPYANPLKFEGDEVVETFNRFQGLSQFQKNFSPIDYCFFEPIVESIQLVLMFVHAEMNEVGIVYINCPRDVILQLCDQAKEVGSMTLLLMHTDQANTDDCPACR